LLLTSFDHAAIEEVTRRTDVDAGLLVAHRPIESVRLADWFPRGRGPRFLVWYYETLDPAVLEQAAAQDIRSLVYGVLTREEHQFVAAWDLYGVITDHPEFLLGAPGRQRVT